MATLQSPAFLSPVSHSFHQPSQTRLISVLNLISLSVEKMHSIMSGNNMYRLELGMICLGVHRSIHSTFNGQTLHLSQSRCVPQRRSQTTGLVIKMIKPTIQFIQGIDEQTIPDVKLTKSRDGTNGMAIFKFDQPSVFDSSSEVGEITGFFMIDEEGVLQSVDVNAKFVGGKPAGIEAKYVMRSPREWDRFMRFMERYSVENGLQFVKK
ncbi:Photosystem II Psb28, class 1 [Dillenia turbinata]|uniref:Photosystem II reaction center Psb28 protein n=1 Tax=Dillenia turbinata TaxID=194707 RepID=A0AAN8ZNR8_9MAGN